MAATDPLVEDLMKASKRIASSEDLLRRALKNHDAIAAALRTGYSSQKLFKAIDDMKKVKDEATVLGLYGKA